MKGTIGFTGGLLFTLAFFSMQGSCPSSSTAEERFIAPADTVKQKPSFLDELRVKLFYDAYKAGIYRVDSVSRAFYYPQAVKMFLEAGFSLDKAQLYAELPTIESNWNPGARSNTNALGFWQQVSSTATRYGVKTKNTFDERHDFLASTRGAIRHLQELERIFDGDPVKVLFAYNGGEGEVIRKMKVHGTSDAFALNFTRDETFDFAPKVIGAHLAISNNQ